MRLPRILCTALTLTANDTKSEMWKKYQVLEIILSQKKNEIRPDLKLILYSYFFPQKELLYFYIRPFHNIKKIVVHRNNKFANNRQKSLTKIIQRNIVISRIMHFDHRYLSIFSRFFDESSIDRKRRKRKDWTKDAVRDRFRFARRLKGVS